MFCRLRIVLLTALFCWWGCTSAADHRRSLHSTEERELTAGTVRREIRPGMSQAAVAEVLGAPNIVTRDSAGRETWIYDKIATEVSFSESGGRAGGGAAGAGAGGDTLIVGLLRGAYERRAGAKATSQKTLTVIIKFDASSRVETFSYHSSRF